MNILGKWTVQKDPKLSDVIYGRPLDNLDTLKHFNSLKQTVCEYFKIAQKKGNNVLTIAICSIILKCKNTVLDYVHYKIFLQRKTHN